MVSVPRSGGRSRPLGLVQRRRARFNPWQVNPEVRTLTRLAVYPNRSAALPDDSVYRRQAQTRAFACLLGGEERLEKV